MVNTIYVERDQDLAAVSQAFAFFDIASTFVSRGVAVLEVAAHCEWFYRSHAISSRGSLIRYEKLHFFEI